MDTLAATLLMISGIFLILLVLVQRGRGGGLAGAFGGMGGQSAFGTKAGDVFTKITVVVAVVWVLLAGGSILAFRASTGGYNPPEAPPENPAASATTGDGDAASSEIPKQLSGEPTSEETEPRKTAPAESDPGTKPTETPTTPTEGTPEAPAKTGEFPAPTKPGDEPAPADNKDAEKPADPPADENKNDE